MKRPLVAFTQTKTAQRGVAAVEFAIVAMLFFTMLFGAMEFGRLMYVWNTVQEVSRNAARLAVVTDFASATALSAIKQAAVFRADAGALPGASEITSDMVKITYLQADGTPATLPANPGDNIAACLDDLRVAECIRFVETCVSTGATCDPDQSVLYAPMISLFSFLGIDIPMSTVRMPAESLGFVPDM
jgi:Flp pilus assembly protein TadG